MLNKVKKLAVLQVAVFILMSIQGCMAASTSLRADEAFALSASALSGIDQYEIEGEVTIVGPAGFISGKAGYEGEVIGHGNLKLKWTTLSLQAASIKTPAFTSYQPLRLLEHINKKSAKITYVEFPNPNKIVRFNIKLDDQIALERVRADLRAEMKLLRSENDLLKRDPAESDKILSKAEKRLEEALATLKVMTTCEWTANPKGWLPRQLKEKTTMSYKWNTQTFKEERTSVTHFHLNVQDDTIKKIMDF